MDFLFIMLYALMLFPFNRIHGQAFCPCGWSSYFGFCYYYHDGTLTRSAARSYCQDTGGDLVSIHSSLENSIVNVLIKDNSWIGLEVRSGVGRWLDSSQFVYNASSLGSISPDINFACSFMTPYSGVWILQTSNCDSDTHNFVCKNVESIREIKCDNNNNYCISPVCSTYEDAKSTCEESGKNLAELNPVDIHSELHKIMISHGFEKIWTLSTASSSKCGLMFYSKQGWNREDADDCTTLHPYICSNIQPTTTTTTVTPMLTTQTSISITSITPSSNTGVINSTTSNTTESNLATTALTTTTSPGSTPASITTTTTVTPSACISSFEHKVPQESGVHSNCQELEVVASLNISACLNLCCFLGGNTVNIYNDVCSVRRCKGNLMLVISGIGWDVYVLKTTDSIKSSVMTTIIAVVVVLVVLVMTGIVIAVSIWKKKRASVTEESSPNNVREDNPKPASGPPQEESNYYEIGDVEQNENIPHIRYEPMNVRDINSAVPTVYEPLQAA